MILAQLWENLPLLCDIPFLKQKLYQQSGSRIHLTYPEKRHPACIWHKSTRDAAKNKSPVVGNAITNLQLMFQFLQLCLQFRVILLHLWCKLYEAV